MDWAPRIRGSGGRGPLGGVLWSWAKYLGHSNFRADWRTAGKVQFPFFQQFFASFPKIFILVVGLGAGLWGLVGCVWLCDSGYGCLILFKYFFFLCERSGLPIG